MHVKIALLITLKNYRKCMLEIGGSTLKAKFCFKLIFLRKRSETVEFIILTLKKENKLFLKKQKVTKCEVGVNWK